MKNKIFIILISISIIIIIIIASLYLIFTEEEEKFSIFYEFQTDINSEVILILPVLINYLNDTPDLYNYLSVYYGDPIFKVNDSKFGKMLYITTNGSCKIGLESHNIDLIEFDGNDYPLNFNGKNELNGTHFCYFDYQNIDMNRSAEIHIQYFYWHMKRDLNPTTGYLETDETINLFGIIQKGWNELNKKVSIIST